MLGSSPAGITVAVAELAMLRIVVPNDAGSNPVGHTWVSRNGKQALPQLESPLSPCGVKD